MSNCFDDVRRTRFELLRDILLVVSRNGGCSINRIICDANLNSEYRNSLFGLLESRGLVNVSEGVPRRGGSGSYGRLVHITESGRVVLGRLNELSRCLGEFCPVRSNVGRMK